MGCRACDGLGVCGFPRRRRSIFLGLGTDGSEIAVCTTTGRGPPVRLVASDCVLIGSKVAMNVTLGVAALIAMALFPTLGGAKPAANRPRDSRRATRANVAVNDHGQVVGKKATAGRLHAFSWTAAGGMVDLGTLGGTTAAVGVTITVRSSVQQPPWRQPAPRVLVDGRRGNGGPRYSRGEPQPCTAVNDNRSGRWLELLTRTTPSCGRRPGEWWTSVLSAVRWSEASAINDNGQVVGSSAIAGERGPRLLVDRCRGNGGPRVFGKIFSSYALAVNDHGQVVGSSHAPGRIIRAFSWTAAGGMVNIGTLCRLTAMRSP